MPNNKKFSISVIILTSVVGIGMILGGYFMWKQQEVINPTEELMAEHPQVIEHELNDENQKLQVEVKLEYEPFLNKTTKDLEGQLDNIAGEEGYTIEFVDERDENIDEARYELQYILIHHWHTKDIKELKRNIDKLSEQHSLDHIQVHILDNSFLIQMRQGSNYLIEVMDPPENDGSDQG